MADVVRRYRMSAGDELDTAYAISFAQHSPKGILILNYDQVEMSYRENNDMEWVKATDLDALIEAVRAIASEMHNQDDHPTWQSHEQWEDRLNELTGDTWQRR